MTIEKSLTIDSSHPSLAGHFPGNPIVPGVVLLGEVLDLIGESLGQSFMLSQVPSVKFHSPLRPNEPLQLTFDILTRSCRHVFLPGRRKTDCFGPIHFSHRRPRLSFTIMSKRWLAQQERGHRWAYQCILWVALRLGRKTARALLYPICIYYVLFSWAASRGIKIFLDRVLQRPVTLIGSLSAISCLRFNLVRPSLSFGWAI